jgi:hypothetical protein
MKEHGYPLSVAVAFEMWWKALPSQPISPSRPHVQTFVALLTTLKEAVEPVLQPYKQHRATGADPLPEFSRALYNAINSAVNDVPGLSNVYPYSGRRIRGLGTKWSDYAPHQNVKLLRQLADLSWNDVIKERKASKAPSGSRVQRDAVVREGPDYRSGADVSGDDFIKTFMFSGVEYGNWTNQKERSKHLNFAYDSLNDFARIMGWEPGVLSLGGRLGLCIGSRGRGGKRAALAHFEPANMAINLTRMRGDGSLAHEYFHAVACHYGRLATGAVSDVTNTLGYSLRESGPVPDVSTYKNGLRDEVRSAFFNLMVAIMRKPREGGDPTDINSYTELSDMLKGSIGVDGSSKLYWSTPAEMFARAMEIWVRDRLADAGERNDYLVSATKDSVVYPNAEHLERINTFVSPWLEATVAKVQQVNHPYLGEIGIPTLYSKLGSLSPLGRSDLVELAHSELKRLFAEKAPALHISTERDWAGMYMAGANILMLNEELADKGTFYHEAWHACHHKLLTVQERRGLNDLFTPGNPLAEQVLELMKTSGMHPQDIEDARGNPEEIAAYAFQFWSVNQLEMESDNTPQFRRTKGFIDARGCVESISAIRGW